MKEKWNKVKSMVKKWGTSLVEDFCILYEDHPVIYVFIFYCVGFFLGFVKVLIKGLLTNKKGDM